MSALPQAIAPNPHTNLLNGYVQIANKMGFQQQQQQQQQQLKSKCRNLMIQNLYVCHLFTNKA
jgi:hypothetical protein